MSGLIEPCSGVIDVPFSSVLQSAIDKEDTGVIKKIYHLYPDLIRTHSKYCIDARKFEVFYGSKVKILKYVEELNRALIKIKDIKGIASKYLIAWSPKRESGIRIVSDVEPRQFPARDELGRTAMHIGARDEDLEEIMWAYKLNKYLIKTGDGAGLKPIHIAAEYGKVESIKLFCEIDKKTLRLVDDFGQTCMHIAASYGQLKAIETICGLDSDLINVKDNQKRTPMHEAACSNDPETIRKIFALKTSLTREKDIYGRTPIHIAAALGNIEAINELFEIDSEAISIVDNTGKTPMHLAGFWGRRNSIVKLNKLCPKLLRTVDFEGNTVMHIAVKNEKTDALKVIHELDRDLYKVKNNSGQDARKLNSKAMGFLDLSDSEILEMREWILQRNEYLKAHPKLLNRAEQCSITQDKIYDLVILKTKDVEHTFERHSLLEWFLMHPVNPLTREEIFPEVIREIFADREKKVLVKK